MTRAHPCNRFANPTARRFHSESAAPAVHEEPAQTATLRLQHAHPRGVRVRDALGRAAGGHHRERRQRLQASGHGQERGRAQALRAARARTDLRLAQRHAGDRPRRGHARRHQRLLRRPGAGAHCARPVLRRRQPHRCRTRFRPASAAVEQYLAARVRGCARGGAPAARLSRTAALAIHQQLRGPHRAVAGGGRRRLALPR